MFQKVSPSDRNSSVCSCFSAIELFAFWFMSLFNSRYYVEEALFPDEAQLFIH